ncbi:MAG: formate C-acetyltransferase/glycerol dehydratase family glycyl radical enzyme [Candidatus Atribacteria bacterium]|nr:formate C-acetyltransferase/glycerol dehydratase family glycyl radical enzyme [Candidatus Atribacteria bacterium]
MSSIVDNRINHKRIQALKDQIIQTVPEICSERAKIYTRVYRDTENEPIIIRRARALRTLLNQMTIFINDQELIVGNQASTLKSAPIFPEYAWEWIDGELDRLPSRDHDRFLIRKEVIDELRDLFPYWKGKSLYERCRATQPPEVMKATQMGILSWEGNATSGEGHIVPDFEMILQNGIDYFIQEADLRCQTMDLSQPENLKRRFFYQAVGIAFRGVKEFILRFAVLSENLALIEKDPERKNQLLVISSNCRHLSEKPPLTFYQALQLVWFTHLIEQLESSGHSVSLGRVDQYLFPYFRRDLDQNLRFSPPALELIIHFFLKLNTITKVRSEKHSRTQSGNPMYQNLVIGGQTSDGLDATNQLSYLFLEGLSVVRLPEPNFYVRIHENLPSDFLMKTLEVIEIGMGMPALVNDKVIIPSLMNRGVGMEDAYNYSTMGCLEVQVPGKWGYRANGKTKLNLLKIFELALNRGKDPRTGIELHPGAGDLSTFQNFDQLLSVWEDQLQYYTRLHVIADNLNDLALEELVPNPFGSAVVRDCLERGKHLNEGGAVYDITSGALVGVPNLGNSLMTIKKLIFDRGTITGQDLKDALEQNFEGEKAGFIHQLIMNQVPKFGEDNDEVDYLTKKSYELYCRIIPSFKNCRFGRGPIGGNYFPSTVTISSNVPAGLVIGATPDGRKAGQPTADGVSPSQGGGKLGPTAVLRSVAKLPTLLMTGGQLLNLRISKDTLESQTARGKLAALIMGFFDLYGWHIQINTISTSTLRNAQAHPEKYRDLVVRVAGYSALFTNLDPLLQEDIIARLEHAL